MNFCIKLLKLHINRIIFLNNYLNTYYLNILYRLWLYKYVNIKYEKSSQQRTIQKNFKIEIHKPHALLKYSLHIVHCILKYKYLGYVKYKHMPKIHTRKCAKCCLVL